MTLVSNPMFTEAEISVWVLDIKVRDTTSPLLSYYSASCYLTLYSIQGSELIAHSLTATTVHCIIGWAVHWQQDITYNSQFLEMYCFYICYSKSKFQMIKIFILVHACIKFTSDSVREDITG